jgi:hypothetical protein
MPQGVADSLTAFCGRARAGCASLGGKVKLAPAATPLRPTRIFKNTVFVFDYRNLVQFAHGLRPNLISFVFE